MDKNSKCDREGTIWPGRRDFDDGKSVDTSLGKVARGCGFRHYVDAAEHRGLTALVLVSALDPASSAVFSDEFPQRWSGYSLGHDGR